jgi:hypothetical protein
MEFLHHITRSLNRLTDSQGVRLYINHQYARYGTMTELKIDDQQKSIDATLQLRGEKEPIHLHIANYTLNADANTLTIAGIHVSREWMNTLANEMLKDKPFPLPPAAAKWLKMIL